MKKPNYIIAILCLLLVSSCRFYGKKIDGNGKVTSENRTVTNVSKIRVEGNINVVIENGLASGRVEADENLIPFILTETDGDWIEIKVKKNYNLHSTKPITVYVSTPTISQVKLAGSGDIIANGKFSSNEKMSFGLAGSGSMTINLNAPAVEASIAGSGTIHLSGETRNAKIEIAGSGDYDGANMKAENVDVHIAGSGDAIVFADLKLKASIAGSGNVKYTGNATIEKSVAGSGEVIKMP